MQVTVTFDHDEPAASALWKALSIPVVTPRPGPSALSGDPVAAEPVPSEPAEAAAPEMTPAQARAAKARAAKAAAKAAPSEPVPDAEDVSGPAPNGAETEEDFGLTQPSSMSPGEAHEAALALVRDIFAAGKHAEVKALQKEWGVIKFYDVPLDKAYDFYASAMKVAQQTGLRK